MQARRDGSLNLVHNQGGGRARDHVRQSFAESGGRQQYIHFGQCVVLDVKAFCKNFLLKAYKPILFLLYSAPHLAGTSLRL